MTTSTFPAEFADLEPFSAWVFDTWRERYEYRLNSNMVEMQAFYDAMMPRLADLLEYCNRYELDALPADVRNLVLLALAFGEVSFTVDAWHQPRVPDTGSADMMMVREPLL